MKIDLDKIFTGETVRIVGGGPSLIGFDFDRISGRVITVNDSCYFVDSEMLVSIDKAWHITNKAFLDSYEGILLTDREPGHEAVVIEYTQKAAYSYEWTIKKVNLSGFVAIAAAIHLGAEKIILLGFDGGYDEQSNHYHHNPRVVEKDYLDKNQYFEIFKENNIINVGPSKIETFRKVPLEVDFYAA